ncbi:MAG: substrate-binding domain-containing protein [Planctomycetes bacterium]|jgi:ribose transport system substrate-binding protein|nr:substrate-binding domain-containing protein [Planctomycetota bacterium]
MRNAVIAVVFVALIAGFVTIGLLRKGGTQAARRIGVIPKETQSVYWEGVRQGAKKAGDEEGYEIRWNGPEIETDCERQIQIVEDMIAQKVDGIVLAPSNRKALVPAVEKTYARKIPCVIVDSGVETENYLSYLATDNYKGGVLAAQRIGAVLSGKGRVIVVAWTPNSASTDARLQGFRETLAKEFPGITIIDSQFPNPPTMDKARDVTQDMLTRHGGADGIFACNATTAGGALKALDGFQPGEKKIKMVGFDAWPMVVAGLEKGDLDSLILQNPYKMGYEGVKAIIRHLQGEKVDKQVDTGVELITRDRLQDPKVQELLKSQI